jgi:hypothetical protein
VNCITRSCPCRHAAGRLRCAFTVFSMGPGSRRDDGFKCGGNATRPPNSAVVDHQPRLAQIEPLADRRSDPGSIQAHASEQRGRVAMVDEHVR